MMQHEEHYLIKVKHPSDVSEERVRQIIISMFDTADVMLDLIKIEHIHKEKK